MLARRVPRTSPALTLIDFRFPISVYRFSTAPAAVDGVPNFMVDYLVNPIGLSRDEAVLASKKVSHLKSTQEPELIVNLFKQCGGLDQTHIRQLVSSVPRVLSSRSLETLESKIKAFQDIGLSGSGLVGLIRSYPMIIDKSLSTTIIPNICYLRNLVGGCDDKFVKAIKHSTWLLSSTFTLKYVPPNIVLLQQDYHFSNEQIERLVLCYQKILLRRPELLLEVLNRVEGDLGIPRNSKMFFYGIAALGSISELSMENKFNVFRSFGWSDSDIYAMVRSQPLSLLVAESSIKKKLNFYMAELGYTPAYLTVRPALLTYSLEKRVKPRNEVLKILQEHKLVKSSQNLYSLVKLTDKRFIEAFVLPYKDNVPILYKTYTKNKEQHLKA